MIAENLNEGHWHILFSQSFEELAKCSQNMSCGQCKVLKHQAYRHILKSIVKKLEEKNQKCSFSKLELSFSVHMQSAVPLITNIPIQFCSANIRLAQTKLYSSNFIAIGVNSFNWHFEFNKISSKMNTFIEMWSLKDRDSKLIRSKLNTKTFFGKKYESASLVLSSGNV